jgi:hypothetical protein
MGGGGGRKFAYKFVLEPFKNIFMDCHRVLGL